jgi:cell division protein FtsL
MSRRSRPGRPRGPSVALPVLRTALPVLVVAGLAVLFIWSRTRALSAAYELGEAKQAHDQLGKLQRQLQLEVESLRHPRLLEAWAHQHHDMAPPAPGAVLAAGPRDSAGRAGVDGVGHRPTPAEPLSGRAAAGAGAAVEAAADAGVPGAQVALRGPLRAGRAARE